MHWSVEEWQQYLITQARPLPSRHVAIAEALGLTLAESVRSAHDLPLWDNSAMDGFAVRAAEVASASPENPVTLTVIGEVAAGSHEDPALGPGETVRVMTGAPLPTAADAVVRFERAQLDQSPGGPAPDSELAPGDVRDQGDPWSAAAITLTSPVLAGTDVRLRGEDRRRGAVIAEPGEKLSANLAAAIAAAGSAEVAVYRTPRVGVIVTGSELMPPGTSDLPRGAIPESNSVLLAGLVRDADAIVADIRHVSDDPAGLRSAIEALAATCDAIVLTGGLGPGAHDVVRIVLEEEAGVETPTLPMRPGKLQCAGRVRRSEPSSNASGEGAPAGPMIFGLSGNPVAAAISFELFVRPCLFTMQGRVEALRQPIAARATSGWSSPEGITQFTPVRVETDAAGQFVCERVVRSGGTSHAVGAAGRSNGFAVIPEGQARVEPGDSVRVLVFDR